MKEVGVLEKIFYRFNAAFAKRYGQMRPSSLEKELETNHVQLGGRMYKWLLLLLLVIPMKLEGQLLDPDNCWTCSDSRQHFASGFLIDAGLHLFPKWGLVNKPWKRVAVVAVVGAIYEAGQTDISYHQKVLGQPGYGFSLKDEALNIGGAVFSEIVIWGLKKIL